MLHLDLMQISKQKYSSKKEGKKLHSNKEQNLETVRLDEVAILLLSLWALREHF